MLFHKSAMFFAIVYVISNMQWSWKNVLLLLAAMVVFMMVSDKLILSYDSLTGEDYTYSKTVDSGGFVAVAIYAIAIALTLLISKRLKEQDIFLPLVLSGVGFVLYSGRYFSIHILERMSYYFFYFLMLLYPAAFNELKPRDRLHMRFWFELLAIILFAYRLSNSSFSGFRLFW